jgi:hypothetical protein
MFLRMHLVAFSDQLRQDFGLDGLAAMDLNLYPTARSSMNPHEELPRVLRQVPVTKGGLAMVLREWIWQGTTIETERLCPRCSHSALRILQSSGPIPELVLACDTCSYVESTGGVDWDGTKLVIPTTAALDAKSR